MSWRTKMPPWHVAQGITLFVTLLSENIPQHLLTERGPASYDVDNYMEGYFWDVPQEGTHTHTDWLVPGKSLFCMSPRPVFVNPGPGDPKEQTEMCRQDQYWEPLS